MPLLFYWKGKIASGKWVDRPVDCNDIFPTILDLAGIDPKPFYTPKRNYPAIDGRSLLSLIQSPEGKPSSYDRDTFFWHYPFNVIVRNPIDSKSLTPHSAIRKGDYKLIFDWSGRLFLYDLKKDLSEKNNLVEKRPVLTKKLFTELNIWLDENVADRYMPSLHPDYDPAKDDRDYPFVDLRKKMLGEDFAIQPKSVHNVNNLH